MRWKTFYHLLFFFCILSNVQRISSLSRKRVCVIGAGVSGINSLKQLAMKGDEFQPIVFEKNSNVGGLWIYRQNTDFDEHGLPGYNSMYKNLRINIPKELMAFPDYQEFHGENRSYVRHEDVVSYLRNYTDHFNLRQYIQFNTLVNKVKAIPDSVPTKWHIDTKNLITNETNTTTCDAVMVCNGHFNEPYVPEIPGIDSFHGKTLHSIKYREPEEFVNQTVVILGASWSGMDIGIEISRYAETVYLSHRYQRIEGEFPTNLLQVAGVVAANGSDLILSDGSRVTADTLIFCTGYLYDFPFLDESSGITVTNGKYIHPLHKHLVNIKHPTMAFINIPYPGIPFLFPQAQSLHFMALLEGKVKLTSRVEMSAELPMGTSISKAHYMFEDIWRYYDDDLIRGLQVTTTIAPWYVCAYDAWLDQIQRDLLHFKEKDLRVDEDGRCVRFVARNE